MEKVDMVNHPPHYTFGKFEHVVVVENWELGYHLGNCTKYMMRAVHKNNLIEDLKKASWYLDRAIQKPWCALVSYDLLTKPEHHFEIKEVAADWFKEEDTNLYKAMIHIGLAALCSPNMEILIQQLQAALSFLDRDIIALEGKSTND